MGILDSKTRILDAVLTVEGRRQLSEGTFKVSFATFTDNDVFYEADAEEGHVDPTDRIYLEASSLPQDQVIFEANDEGKVVPLRDKPYFFEKTDLLSSLPGLQLSETASITLVNNNGKFLGYQKNFGARLGVLSSIPLGFKENEVGFSCIDSTNKKTEFYLKKDTNVGNFAKDVYTTYVNIGVKGGISSEDLADTIQSAISFASSSGGAAVEAVSRGKYLYITDANGEHEKVRLNILTGTMTNLTASSPFLIFPFSTEQAFFGGRKDVIDIPAADFASQIAPNLLQSAFDNFEQLRCLSTLDPYFNEDKFIPSTSSIDFNISKIKTSKKAIISQVPTLNSIDSIFSDEKFSSQINFRYLPPIVKTSENVLPDKSDIEAAKNANVLLGDYQPWGDNTTRLSFTTLADQLKDFESYNLTFDETTRTNNLLCQLFEVNKLGEVKKLDVVEFGNARDDNVLDILKQKVYFAGKVFLDDRGTTCYTNIFTLIYSQVEGDEG